MTIQLVLSAKHAYFHQSHLQLGRISCITPASVDIVFVSSLQLLFQQGKSQYTNCRQTKCLQTKCPQTSCRNTCHNETSGNQQIDSQYRSAQDEFLLVDAVDKIRVVFIHCSGRIDLRTKAYMQFMQYMLLISKRKVVRPYPSGNCQASVDHFIFSFHFTFFIESKRTKTVGKQNTIKTMATSITFEHQAYWCFKMFRTFNRSTTSIFCYKGAKPNFMKKFSLAVHNSKKTFFPMISLIGIVNILEQ